MSNRAIRAREEERLVWGMATFDGMGESKVVPNLQERHSLKVGAVAKVYLFVKEERGIFAHTTSVKIVEVLPTGYVGKVCRASPLEGTRLAFTAENVVRRRKGAAPRQR